MKEMSHLESMVIELSLSKQDKGVTSLFFGFFFFWRSLWKESHGFSYSTMLLESIFAIICSVVVRKCLTGFG